jgi:hypothetical protein
VGAIAKCKDQKYFGPSVRAQTMIAKAQPPRDVWPKTGLWALGKEGPEIVLIEPGAVLVINKPSLGVLPVTAWPGGHYCVAVIAHANWQRAVRSDSRWRIK